MILRLLVCSSLLGLVAAAQADDPPPAAKKKAARRSQRPAATKRAGETAPACTLHRARRSPNRPPARSMPEMFDWMMENMARDPATGFANVLREQEGAALQEVTLSPAEEREIGRRFREEYLRQASARGYRIADDPARLSYLCDLVEHFRLRMVHRDRYPRIDVTLIKAPIADGQSFPGGFLIFTTALLDEPDEATVAGVVAHELAHLDRGHLNEYARRDKLARNAFRPDAMDFSPERFMRQGMAMGSLMMSPFRPEHETEADCTAATWLFLDGYDPAALVRFFERLHARNRDRADDNPFFSFARTHPYSLERRDHVRSRLAQLKRWKPRTELGLYAENLNRLVSRWQGDAPRNGR